MKKILYILFSICLSTACSSDGPISDDDQKEKEQAQQTIKALTIYPLGTPKKDIDFDIEIAPDTLARVYSRGEITSGNYINPITVFCLKNNTVHSILIEFFPNQTYDKQLIFDVSCFDPSIKLDVQTTANNLAVALKADSIKGKHNNTPILIRNGFLHTVPSLKGIIMEYGPGN